jgi:hypothetical protein
MRASLVGEFNNWYDDDYVKKTPMARTILWWTLHPLAGRFRCEIGCFHSPMLPVPENSRMLRNRRR